ncbi:901_t:CDS:2, partial [Scutellospora calospora]
QQNQPRSRPAHAQARGNLRRHRRSRWAGSARPRQGIHARLRRSLQPRAHGCSNAHHGRLAVHPPDSRDCAGTGNSTSFMIDGAGSAPVVASGSGKAPGGESTNGKPGPVSASQFGLQVVDERPVSPFSPS